MKMFALVALLCACAGCATVTTLDAPAGTKTADGRPIIATVAVENTDWLLLSFLPVASGDVEKPNAITCSWFRDTVTLQNQLDMLQKESVRLGAREAVDVTTYENDEDFFLLVFLRRKMHTSATLVK